MSRTLAFIVVGFAMLSIMACATGPEVPDQVERERLHYDSLVEWMAMQRQVSAKSAAQVLSELDRLSTPTNNDELFYSALLHQQINAYGNWTLARDQFRELFSAEDITEEQRQLALILERYNQSRINWSRKHFSLQQKQQLLEEENTLLSERLSAAQEEKDILEEKIQALTDIEAAISTRRE